MSNDSMHVQCSLLKIIFFLFISNILLFVSFRFKWTSYLLYPVTSGILRTQQSILTLLLYICFLFKLMYLHLEKDMEHSDLVELEKDMFNTWLIYSLCIAVSV